MKKFSHLINLRVVRGEWHHIKIDKNSIAIFHLLFTDDVLFFMQSFVTQAHLIRDTLRAFYGTFGLKANDAKSKAFYLPSVPIII